MPKNNIQKGKTKTKTKTKNIKNLYIQKINSVFKVTTDRNKQLPCLYFLCHPYRNNAPAIVIQHNQQDLLLQRKINNKNAARKARERKKIYQNLLEQYVKKLQTLNEKGKQLQKSSNQMLLALNKQDEPKSQDQIGQYLIQIQYLKSKFEKDCSKATMDFDRQCQLNKIICQIQKIAYPRELQLQNLSQNIKTPQFRKNLHKMQRIQEEIPQIFAELKNVCSDHASLHILNNKNKNTQIGDPYIGKTLMQKYYSPTLCRKDITDFQVHRYVSGLSKLQNYCCQVKQLVQ